MYGRGRGGSRSLVRRGGARNVRALNYSLNDRFSRLNTIRRRNEAQARGRLGRYNQAMSRRTGAPAQRVNRFVCATH